MKTLILTILLTLVFSIPALADRDRLRYNYMEDKWEYAAPKDRLKLNYMENSWSYENPKSTLKYNPYESRFEYAR